VNFAPNLSLGRFALVAAALLLLVSSATARAEQTPPSDPPRPLVTFGGYAEAFYQWNFNSPSNGITPSVPS
jgi:hypothetical protein